MTDTKLDGLIAAREIVLGAIRNGCPDLIMERIDAAIAAERKSAEVLISTQDRLGRDRDIILEAINEYDGWILDDDYDADRMLGKIMMRMKERIA